MDTEKDLKELVKQEEVLALLKEAFVFVSCEHRALDPWREALLDWRSRVEETTGWNSFQAVQAYRRKS